MLFLGAKWARKSKSEVTLSSKCLVEKLWLLLCFVGKKLTPSFFKFSRQLLSFCTLFKKKLRPLDHPISLYGNSRTTRGKNFGVAFFVLLAISMPKNNIVSLVNFFLPLEFAPRLRLTQFLSKFRIRSCKTRFYYYYYYLPFSRFRPSLSLLALLRQRWKVDNLSKPRNSPNQSVIP